MVTIPRPIPISSTATVMFELTFLGISASVPAVDRNHPGQLIPAGRPRILVDCGEGTQRQLLRTGTGFRRLRRPRAATHAPFPLTTEQS